VGIPRPLLQDTRSEPSVGGVWPITEVFVNEWFGALILIRVALESSVEGDDNSFPSIVYALRLVYGFLPQIHRRPFKRS
jgi:hypothetical protein